MDGSPDVSLDRFEVDRLALFAAHGFAGTSQWVADGADRRTYLTVGGDGSPTRLLIHGGLSESATWAVLAGRLGGRLVIPDRPGYGLSFPVDYRRVGDFFEAAANWTGSVVDGLGEERVDLIGSSMGGFFAIAYAQTHPERVRRLVLLGYPAGIDRQVPIFLRLWGNPVLGRLVMKLGIDDPEQLRTRVYPGLVAHPDRVPADQLEVEFVAAHLPHAALTSHTMLRATMDLMGWRRKYLVRDRLGNLDVPTLIAWGDRDTAFGPPSLGEAVASEMPNATFALLADAGHLPWIDQPDLTADTIASFLRPDSREETSTPARSLGESFPMPTG